MAGEYDGNTMQAPGLNDYGNQGWEVAGVVPDMHLYDHAGKPFYSTKKMVLLLKRPKS